MRRFFDRPTVRATARVLGMTITVLAIGLLGSNVSNAATGCHGLELNSSLSVPATTEYEWSCGDATVPYTTGIYENIDGTLSAQSFSQVPGMWALHLYDGANERLMEEPLAGPVYFDGGQVVTLQSTAQAPASSYGAALVFTPDSEYAEYMLVKLVTFYA